MKKIYFIWSFIILVLLFFITFLGINISKKNSDYKNLENDIKIKVEKYLGANLNEYPERGSNRILLSKIIDSGIDINLYANENDLCNGYVLVSKQVVGYETSIYIKCKNYTTKGYQEIE